MSDDLPTTGLGEAEARRRLADDGPNIIGGHARPPTLAVALDALREPMFIMLVAGGGLYLAMGKLSDGLLLLSFVLVVIVSVFARLDRRYVRETVVNLVDGTVGCRWKRSSFIPHRRFELKEGIIIRIVLQSAVWVFSTSAFRRVGLFAHFRGIGSSGFDQSQFGGSCTLRRHLFLPRKSS